MRLFLHIGTHKTGTTSVQKFLHEHREVLAERGFWYPSYEIVGYRPHYAHLEFAHGLANQEHPGMGMEMAKRFAREVSLRGADYQAVLISAEPFYRHLVPFGKERKDADSKARLAYMELVREVFSAFDIEVVVCLRRQDQFAQSLYNEHLKVTSYPHGFEQFLGERYPLFDYESQLSSWEGVFGALNVSIFEDLVKAPEGLVKAFLQRLGAPLQGLSEAALQNQSLPLQLLEFKRLLNGSRMKADQLSLLGKLMDHAEFLKSAGLSDKKESWFTPDQQASWLAQFDLGNAEIVQRWVKVPRPQLFPPASVDPVSFSGMNMTDFFRLTGHLLNFMAR